MLEASGLPEDVLTRVWDLADVSRDGLLDVEEFCVACHLLRFVKAGKGYTFYKQYVKIAQFWTWRIFLSINELVNELDTYTPPNVWLISPISRRFTINRRFTYDELSN